MAFELPFLDLMASTVTVTPFLRRSTDGYGTPTYSTATFTAQAHVLEDVTLVRKLTGQSTQVQSVLWIATTRAVSPQDKLTLFGTTKRVVDSFRLYDNEGVHHVKVLCG